MRLSHLALENYRGFEKLDLALDPRLTVLVGANGSGKSSVLDALASMTGFAKSLVGAHVDAVVVDASDIRNEMAKTTLTLRVQEDDGWFQALKVVERGKNPGGQGNQGLQWTDRHQEHLRDFIGIYLSSWRTTQAWELPPAEARMVGPDAAVLGVLSNYQFTFRRFVDWFLEAENLENERRVRTQDLAFRLPVLNQVRSAVQRLLGADAMEFRRRDNQLVIRRDGQELALGQLSDGERGLVLLVGDIARRMAQLGDPTGDPLGEAGLVIIDEIDLHLHPAWQRRVVPQILAVFPKCQFVIATHSPQVLSTVPRIDSQIVLLEKFQAHQLRATEGRDSNSLLDAVFGVPERPEAVVARLHEVSRLIDAFKYEEAKASLDGLEKELTNRDPDIVHYRSLIDFIERGRAADQQGT